ncbi:hypothetical protein TcasGA2_TC031182 [Tribolium castaneum]|uniref:Uncharacterized protein n=1 Tax=Tribolium castaneum TaxID=7070 RepID=A0A139WG23_TRICA|nr:hypothetical protein TcasGA2_TC031182 [Tribolium castaneum]
MGNDIKLPAVQRKDLQTSQKSVLKESKEHLLDEIEKISQRVAAITQQIDQIEHNLKEINRNIDYYKSIITEMSNALHQLEIEEINANLSRENYIERGKLG